MLCRPSDVVPVGILVSLSQSVYIFLCRSEWECFEREEGEVKQQGESLYTRRLAPSSLAVTVPHRIILKRVPVLY